VDVVVATEVVVLLVEDDACDDAVEVESRETIVVVPPVVEAHPTIVTPTISEMRNFMPYETPQHVSSSHGLTHSC
jgi:hypothetical protein